MTAGIQDQLALVGRNPEQLAIKCEATIESDPDFMGVMAVKAIFRSAMARTPVLVDSLSSLLRSCQNGASD